MRNPSATTPNNSGLVHSGEHPTPGRFLYHRAQEVKNSSSVAIWSASVFGLAYYQYKTPRPEKNSYASRWLNEIKKAVATKLPATYRPCMALSGHTLAVLSQKEGITYIKTRSYETQTPTYASFRACSHVMHASARTNTVPRTTTTH